MVVFVLDTSALLRFADKEAGTARVAEIFTAKEAGTAKILMSAIHWGEVVHIILKRYGLDNAEESLSKFRALAIEIVPVTEQRAERTAAVRHKYKIPYADAFGVELAGDSPDHRLVTAEFDVKPASQDISIEFLPAKLKT
ncbi:PIN domain-containing protein [Granulicella sp. S156]|uniref:PIN domain-containing protein n=1 Tax=Granulicella sp. S156 TaxID=1747224 RepID=UPI00131D2DAD|nr:PIN domain-containing protein [Granulicella sp. S156]